MNWSGDAVWAIDEANAVGVDSVSYTHLDVYKRQTPTRSLEASGTSGEKALMNGVVNFSVLDLSLIPI